MNIIKQNKRKINGILETFDRMIINGYSLNLCNYRHFLYYLIQNNIKLTEFDKFALNQTNELCNHIDNYIKAVPMFSEKDKVQLLDNILTIV